MSQTQELHAEIANRFTPERDCNGLLYTPVETDLVSHETRIYRLTLSGDEAAARTFVTDVLSDAVSDEVSFGDTPQIQGYRYYLELGIKRGTLDLEKEYVLRFYRELSDPGFELIDLQILRRIYLIGSDQTTPVERFVKDIVNPAIHTWNISHA